MGNILRSPINNNAIILTPRTGSHSMVYAAISEWWPETLIEDPNQHPACWIPHQENWNNESSNVSIIVRNPIERFRSMVAHRLDISLEEHLQNPFYGPLPIGNFVKYFRFEDQLQECANWLGITTYIPKLDSTEEEQKPILTIEQEIIIQQFYSKDIILWNSLQNKEML